MAQEGTYETKKRKEATIESKKQRALIFQGGGALGAYEAGAYRVLYDWISRHIEKKDENVFDVIAGTSIGAINGAIIISHFLKKKNADINKSLNANEYWKGSADTLEKFWKEVQTKYFFTDWLDLNFWPWDLFHNTIGAIKKGWNNILHTAEESMPDVQSNVFIKEWFDLLHFATEAWDIPASAEAARRYWTTRTLGAPNVAAAIPRWDLKYWDSSHGFRFRGEQKRLPFWWFNPTFSLKESCQNYIKFPIKTDQVKDEPRFLLVTVDVQSGDTVSFDSYDNKTEYNEYDQWKNDDDYNKSPLEQSHIIRYPNGIEWDHLSTTFSLPDLYRHVTLEDEKSGTKRTFWDGGILSNTPLRELIDQHKKYWKNKIGDELLWDGIMEEKVEKKIKMPALDVYIVDVWPAKLLDDPVPSDNDFVASRRTDLILLDKTEYEESVSRMVTQYMRITEELLKTLNETDKSNKIKEILDTPIIDNTLNAKNIKKYRDLLKGNFDINRVMRIERKDDLYTIGYAIADFSARSMNQLLELGKRDAFDNLIHSLCHTIENLKEETDSSTKNILSKHLEKAKESLQSKENDYYQEVMNHLYGFIDEVNRMESDKKLTEQNANLLRP
jgi:predicted acylesterase/phospholipase RssA